MTGRGNPPKVRKMNTEARHRRGNLLLFYLLYYSPGFAFEHERYLQKSFFVLSVDILTPRRCFASVLRHTIK